MLITGVVNDVPVKRETPPVRSVYQLIRPALAVALRITVPGQHLDPEFTPVIVGIELTVIG